MSRGPLLRLVLLLAVGGCAPSGGTDAAETVLRKPGRSGSGSPSGPAPSASRGAVARDTFESVTLDAQASGAKPTQGTASPDAVATPSVGPSPPGTGPLPGGLAFGTDCTGPAPSASPEAAGPDHGAYADQPLPAGWRTTHRTEASLTTAITGLKADAAAFSCFQKYFPGAAVVYFRLTELSLASPAARTVAEVKVSLTNLVLKVGMTTSVAGLVTYTDGSTDGDVTLTTSDAAVVSLGASPGQIKAERAGTATLRVQAAADVTRAASVTVTVLAP